MSSLYEVAQHEERWGFWCDAFSEKEMLEQVKGGSRQVGAFIHPEPDIGARKVMAVGGDRKAIVADLPKTWTFFAFNPPPDHVSKEMPIDWVGHIDCFPYPGPKSVMLQTCYGDSLVAFGKEDPEEPEIWVCVVEVLPGMLVPPTTCCG